MPSTESQDSLALSTFFDVINNLHSFMTGSNRHAKFMEIQKQVRTGRPALKLVRASDFHWSLWSCAERKVLTLLDCILEYSEFSSGNTKVEADSLLQQMQTMFNRQMMINTSVAPGNNCGEGYFSVWYFYWGSMLFLNWVSAQNNLITVWWLLWNYASQNLQIHVRNG